MAQRAQRGVYRAVYSALFDDPDYQRLKAPARLLLLTLRQCSDAGPAAIFRYYPEKLAAQTGLATKVIAEALEELQDSGWIGYCYPVVWVRNGLRYDPTLSLFNSNHVEHVRRWLLGLPKSPIVAHFCEYYKIVYPFEGDGGWDGGSHGDPMGDPMRVPLGIHPAPAPVPSTSSSSSTRRARARLTDEEFIAGLRANQAFAGLDIDHELARMDAYLLANPHKHKSRRFVVAWLMRSERPMAPGAIARKGTASGLSPAMDASVSRALEQFRAEHQA